MQSAGAGDARQHLVDQLAPRLILLPHPLRPVRLRRDRGEGGALYGAVHRPVNRPVHPRGGGGEIARGDQVADAPARHRVGLREGVAVEQAVAQAGDLQCGDERRAVEDDVVVRLVGEDEEVALLGNFRQFIEFLPPVDDTGRVAGVADDDHLRAVRRRANRIEIEMEIRRGADKDGLRSNHLDQVGIE